MSFAEMAAGLSLLAIKLYVCLSLCCLLPARSVAFSTSVFPSCSLASAEANLWPTVGCWP